MITKNFPMQHWKYVKTHENPADHASRPQDLKSLMASRWFRGPEILWERHIRRVTPIEECSELPETMKDAKCLATTHETQESRIATILERTSSWEKAIRICSNVITFDCYSKFYNYTLENAINNKKNSKKMFKSHFYPK